VFAPDFADSSRIYAIVSSRDQLRRRLHRLRLKPAGARGAEKRAAIDGGAVLVGGRSCSLDSIFVEWSPARRYACTMPRVVPDGRRAAGPAGSSAAGDSGDRERGIGLVVTRIREALFGDGATACTIVFCFRSHYRVRSKVTIRPIHLSRATVGTKTQGQTSTGAF